MLERSAGQRPTLLPNLAGSLPNDLFAEILSLPTLWVLIAKAPLALVVQAGAPYKNLGELLAAAKARPSAISYASFGPGSGPQLAAGLLGLSAGIEMLEVPYKGSAAALTDLIGGQVQVGIDTVAATAPHIKLGRLRALAIIGSVRSMTLPDAVFDAWYAVAVPGRTEHALRARIERRMKAVLADPALQARIRDQGMEPTFVGADALRPMVDAEISRYCMLAHRARIVVE